MIDRNLAFKDLLFVKGILDKLGVKFFLFQGTCLGAYRDKDFIEYDIDIDLGIFGEEHLNIVKKAMEEQGFLMNLEATGAITTKKNIIFNILFFKKEGDEFVSYVREGALTPMWCFPERFGELKEIEFKGEKFLAPSPIEEYLEWTYGKDWKKPIRGKPAQDYWNTNPKKVAKLLIEKNLTNWFNPIKYPKIKEEIDKLKNG